MAATKKASTGRTTKKNTTAKKTTSGASRNTGKQTPTRKKATAAKYVRSAEEVNTYKDQMAFETGITILVMLTISLFLYLSFFGLCGRVGIVLTGLLFGLIGWLAWILPVFAVVGYTFAVVNRGDRRVPRKLVSAGIFFVLLAALGELMFQQEILTEYYTSNHVLHPGYLECLYLSLHDVAVQGKGSGGMLGRFIGSMLSAVIGKWGAAAVLAAMLCLCAYIFYGLEMMAKIRKRNAYRQEMQEAYETIREEENYREPSYRVMPAARKVQPQSCRTGGKRPEAAGRTAAERNIPGINLRQAGQILDEMEKKQAEQTTEFPNVPMSAGLRKSIADPEITEERKEADAGSSGKRTRRKRVREQSIPDGMQEIYGAPDTQVPSAKAAPEEVYHDNVRDIPIFREEMNHKFGHAGEVSEETAPTEKAYDSPQAADPVPGMDEQQAQALEPEEDMASAKEKMPEEADITVSAAGQPAQAEAVTPRERVTKAHTTKRIGGEDYVSQSDTFNALNDSKEDQTTIPYQFPPLDLLSLPKASFGGVSDETLRQTAARLQSTLQSFNVNVQMGAVTCGPTVTRYEVLPEQGVRVNKITNLADDLKLSLAASSIRIEAPIPGKSAVGIEVPNEKPSSVHFRELLQGDAFEKAKSPVTFAVGKDIAGKVIMTDIAKMPHLLIAGATGSGKSVCINTLIMSILYKSDPNDVKLIMIDPKVVELSVYNGIPHLFCPVVTDPKEAAAALNWAVREMMDRYEKFRELGVRGIEGYNEKIRTVENAEQAGHSKMPLLVIIVDEFADLMMVASKEIEDAVCRLAQLARAAGIHLILATQRPSVNVITGVIKANIPSRIAFSVSSAIDSRTILDKGGAEKLLGKGDMLFFPSGYSEPVRVQGAFVSDKEVSDVVEFLCRNNETPVYNDKVTEIVETQQDTAEEEAAAKPDQDEYFEEAGRFVIESERAAAGQLQRRFSIGFNRAGRIIDQLHKAGVVGPAVGTKPRKVLMTMEEFEQYLHPEQQESAPVDAEALDAIADEFSEQ